MLIHFRRWRRRLPLWPAALVVIAFLDCVLAQSLVLQRHALRAHSIAGTAGITARTPGRTGLARAFLGPDPAVTYTFEAGGRKYRRTQHVALRTYETLPLGSTVLITYLRRDPHVSVLAGSITLGSVLFPALALLGSNAVFAVVWLLLYRASRLGRFTRPRRTPRAPDHELPFPPARRVALL